MKNELFILVLLGLMAATSGAAEQPPAKQEFIPDPSSIVRYGPAYRYPQAGWVVVHIEGQPYERGYQHGRLLADEIADYVQTLADNQSPKAPSDGWRQLRLLANSLLLRRFDAEFLEEMKGIADGAAAAGAKFDDRKLDLIDVVALNSVIELEALDSGLKATSTSLEGRTWAQPPVDRSKADDNQHCSAFAATGSATADGQIVFGHITMSGLFEVQHYNVWLEIEPADGHRLRMQTYPGGIMSGFDYYLNDAGLLVTETTIGQTHFDPDGTPVASRIRRAVQYSDSIDQAVKILREHNNGLYSNEWLLADVKTDEIALLELGTRQSKLRRSGEKQWVGGTPGFYWGCNNAKELAVRKESVPSLTARPANLVFCPGDRDKAWLKLYSDHRGQIGEVFAFEALTTPPVAAFDSCDAKFTTSALARKLQTWARFGPPLGRTWEPTPEQIERNAGIQPLVANDWTLLAITNPAKDHHSQAVDLTPLANKEPTAKANVSSVSAAAWRGTLLPKSDADLWLAAGFADYERIVALERDLHEQAEGAKLDRTALDRVEVAHFTPWSDWLGAASRLGHDTPLSQIKTDWASNDWYRIASAKGILLLAALRKEMGAERFDKALDDFGHSHGGQEVSTAEFRQALERAAGRSLAEIFDPWLNSDSLRADFQGNFWALDAFEQEPTRTLIVYGTTGDRDAQREAADRLARKIARRGSNIMLRSKADTEVTETELQDHHLLIVGRPATNAIAARCAGTLPVQFGPRSFTFRDETYAHPDSALIIAGPNPHQARYSVVLFAGLSASATWNCVQSFPEPEQHAVEALLLVAGRHPRATCSRPASAFAWKPGSRLPQDRK